MSPSHVSLSRFLVRVVIGLMIWNGSLSVTDGMVNVIDKQVEIALDWQAKEIMAVDTDKPDESRAVDTLAVAQLWLRVRSPKLHGALRTVAADLRSRWVAIQTGSNDAVVRWEAESQQLATAGVRVVRQWSANLAETLARLDAADPIVTAEAAGAGGASEDLQRYLPALNAEVAYWSYYQDCDRWGVVLDRSVIPRAAVESVAAGFGPGSSPADDERVGQNQAPGVNSRTFSLAGRVAEWSASVGNWWQRAQRAIEFVSIEGSQLSAVQREVRQR